MKKMTILVMIAVLALTAVGFGFAKWSSTVDANVTVNTGTLLVGIRDVGTNDDGSNVGVADAPVLIGPNMGGFGADPQWGVGDNHEGKDVAKLVSTNDPNVCTNIGTINNTSFYNAITESITNGYPWYGPSTSVEVANLGTIPVKLESFEWTWDASMQNLDPWFEIASYTITDSNGAVTTGKGKANFQAALTGIQLHAKEVLKVNVQFGLNETMNGAAQTKDNVLPQNANGKALFHVTASQWNEVK